MDAETVDGRRKTTLDGLLGSPRGSLYRRHPWQDPLLADLYDLFPFEDDLPLYLDLAAKEGGGVLEVACGTGRVLVPLARAGQRVVGVDSSTHMLERAAAKLRSAGPDVSSRATLIEAGMGAFELTERFGLVVIAVNSLAHLVTRQEQQRALSVAARHLRPGGLLAIDVMNPSPAWLLREAGSRHQDLARVLQEDGTVVTRTETVVATDLAAQIRTLRSEYELIAADGSVRKRVVEWPFRYVHRFEAELLLEGAGLDVEHIYGGYDRRPFTSESKVMILLGRRGGTEAGEPRPRE